MIVSRCRRFLRRALVPAGAALAVALACAASVAQAAQPGDYAYRWPLATDGQNAAARQFELTPEVYAALVDPQLGDFEVFNADGQPVPVARLTVDPQAQPGVAEVALPIFALPRAADGSGDDVSLRLERDGTGRLHLLEANVDAGQPQTLIDYVLDADLNRDPARPATVDRLQLRWPETGDARTRFAVDGSDDLEHWETLVDAAAVVSLHQGGAMLQRRDITLPATGLRYLRLRQLDGDPLPGLQVTARRLRAGASALPWRRVTAAFESEAADDFGKGKVYRYRLPASLPVGRVGIGLGVDNATADVIVDARPGTVAATDDRTGWVPMGRTLVFRLRQGGVQVDNEDFVLTAPMAARDWRLRSPVALAPPPKLEVAYLPDRFVFLAQGRGPFVLAAGSRVARRPPLPVEEALAPLRKRLGADWMPPVATLGARADAAGTKAYDEPEKPLDWRRWMLWGFLVVGAAVVGGFALTLLRQRDAGADEADAAPPPPEPAPPPPTARFDAGPPEQGKSPFDSHDHPPDSA